LVALSRESTRWVNLLSVYFQNALEKCTVENDIYTKSDPYDDELHDDLIKALAHSISLIGLQNPICIVANDIPDNPASYRLVSGRKRYAAFLKLERTTIPAHILSYAATEHEQEVRKALATTEENLVRKHYSLIELCDSHSAPCSALLKPF